MSELPEKLETLEDNPTWITLSNVIGFGFNVESRPEVAAEIIKRYNAYPIRQALIKQLIKVCDYAKDVIDSRMYPAILDKVKTALAAAEKME